MRDAVICEPIRTPVGRYGGTLRDVSAADLGSTVVRELITRTGLTSDDIDDVIFGQCYPTSEAPAIGRIAALDAGLSHEVPGWQLDRRCGSGLQAVIQAAMQVQTGAHELVLAGGVESMSQAEFYNTELRWRTGGEQIVFHDRLARGRVTAGGRYHRIEGGMLETAENLRREYRISRQEQDELALRSHQRAVAAQTNGAFTEEIVPVTVSNRSGSTEVDRDEHPRADTTLEALAQLRPIRGNVDDQATVTAGNASGQNDGAAVCIVTHPAAADALGLRPLARIAGWAIAGVPPQLMGIGPVPATAKLLARTGVELSQIDLIEVNEAFAAQVLACTRDWKFTDTDFDRLNVNGSGISLGHPVGATGVRILATLVREMQRRDVRYGLETMCIGGGQGIAALFERIPA